MSTAKIWWLEVLFSRVSFISSDFPRFPLAIFFGAGALRFLIGATDLVIFGVAGFLKSLGLFRGVFWGTSNDFISSALSLLGETSANRGAEAMGEVDGFRSGEICSEGTCGEEICLDEVCRLMDTGLSRVFCPEGDSCTLLRCEILLVFGTVIGESTSCCERLSRGLFVLAGVLLTR